MTRSGRLRRDWGAALLTRRLGDDDRSAAQLLERAADDNHLAGR
jgi:hypothetical protein